MMIKDKDEVWPMEYVFYLLKLEHGLIPMATKVVYAESFLWWRLYVLLLQ